MALALVTFRSLAVELLVYNTNDAGAGSLRQAISDNAALGGGNMIIFSNAVTGTIVLATELAISNNATILGPGAKVLTVSGNNSVRVFHVTGGTVSIAGLTIANGSVSGSANGGGTLVSSATLTIRDCWFSSNHAGSSGGGIYQASGTLTVSGSTFSYNGVTNGDGGGVYIAGTARIDSSTFFFNGSKVYGGGVQNFGSVTLNNCTISGNYADSQGGGGIANLTFGTATLRNTIVAGNGGGQNSVDCAGVFVSGGFNLIGSGYGSSGWGSAGDQIGTGGSSIYVSLGPLQDNGGPTPTMALEPGNPAIDQGDSGGFTTDQRGFPRPFDLPSVTNASGGDGSDIGAFELGSPKLNIQSASSNDVVVSWPYYYSGLFRLESATNPADSNNWSAVTNTQAIVGDQFNVTNSTDTGNVFFRLRSL